MMKCFRKIFLPVSLSVLWAVVSAISVFYHIHRTEGKVITWDAYGYYLYLPAFLKYADWEEYNFVKEHHERYRFSANIYQIHKSPIDKWTPTYLYGMSLMYLPFYLVADGIAKITAYPDDGLSPPYQWSIITGALVYGFFGLLLLAQLLTKIFNQRSAFWALMIFLFASNYAYYVISLPASPHAQLFFIYSLLLWLTWRFFEKPSLFTAFLIGLSAGILTLSRPSEIICILIPLIYGWSKGKPAWKFPVHFVVAGITMVLMLIPQLLLWKSATGQWLYNPYPFSPDWLRPHVIDGLFSYRKGWFVYTPVMLLSVAGFFVPLFRKSNWFYATLIFFLLNIYLVFAWPMWWYTSSFGMRALVQSYPVALISFTAAVYFILQKNDLVKTVFILLAIFLSALNLFQIWQYEQRIIPLDETTKKYYWKVFGETKPDKMRYQFLDNEFEMPKNKTFDCVTLGECLTEPGDDAMFVQDTWGALCNREMEFCVGVSYHTGINQNTKSKKVWLVAEGSYLQLSEKYGDWDYARLVVTIEKNGENLFWRGIRLQQLTSVNVWQPFRFEFETDWHEEANISAYIWNIGPDNLLLHELKLSACVESR